MCARPSCQDLASATLGFSYADRLVELVPLSDEPLPQTYDLCPTHAARTRPPHGWEFRDRRPEDDRLLDRRPRVPADLGGDRTVAVLAAALRAVPGAVSEDARPVPAAEVVPAPPHRPSDLRSVVAAAEPGEAPAAGTGGRTS